MEYRNTESATGSNLAEHVRMAQVVLPCRDLATTLAFFTDRLGFKVSLIFPADSPHTALRNAGFRHYADYMESEAFREGIHELLESAKSQRVAYLCAEQLWWRCHRSLISDYLAAVRGVEVIHIFDEKKTEPHRPSKFVRVESGRLIYDVGETSGLSLTD